MTDDEKVILHQKLEAILNGGDAEMIRVVAGLVNAGHEQMRPTRKQARSAANLAEMKLLLKTLEEIQLEAAMQAESIRHRIARKKRRGPGSDAETMELFRRLNRADWPVN